MFLEALLENMNYNKRCYWRWRAPRRHRSWDTKQHHCPSWNINSVIGILPQMVSRRNADVRTIQTAEVELSTKSSQRNQCLYYQTQDVCLLSALFLQPWRYLVHNLDKSLSCSGSINERIFRQCNILIDFYSLDPHRDATYSLSAQRLLDVKLCGNGKNTDYWQTSTVVETVQISCMFSDDVWKIVYKSTITCKWADAKYSNSCMQFLVETWHFWTTAN